MGTQRWRTSCQGFERQAYSVALPLGSAYRGWYPRGSVDLIAGIFIPNNVRQEFGPVCSTAPLLEEEWTSAYAGIMANPLWIDQGNLTDQMITQSNLHLLARGLRRRHCQVLDTAERRRHFHRRPHPNARGHPARARLCSRLRKIRVSCGVACITQTLPEPEHRREIGPPSSSRSPATERLKTVGWMVTL